MMVTLDGQPVSGPGDVAGKTGALVVEAEAGDSDADRMQWVIAVGLLVLRGGTAVAR